MKLSIILLLTLLTILLFTLPTQSFLHSTINSQKITPPPSSPSSLYNNLHQHQQQQPQQPQQHPTEEQPPIDLSSVFKYAQERHQQELKSQREQQQSSTSSFQSTSTLNPNDDWTSYAYPFPTDQNAKLTFAIIALNCFSNPTTCGKSANYAYSLLPRCLYGNLPTFSSIAWWYDDKFKQYTVTQANPHAPSSLVNPFSTADSSIPSPPTLYGLVMIKATHVCGWEVIYKAIIPGTFVVNTNVVNNAQLYLTTSPFPTAQISDQPKIRYTQGYYRYPETGKHIITFNLTFPKVGQLFSKDKQGIGFEFIPISLLQVNTWEIAHFMAYMQCLAFYTFEEARNNTGTPILTTWSKSTLSPIVQPPDPTVPMYAIVAHDVFKYDDVLQEAFYRLSCKLTFAFPTGQEAPLWFPTDSNTLGMVVAMVNPTLSRPDLWQFTPTQDSNTYLPFKWWDFNQNGDEPLSDDDGRDFVDDTTYAIPYPSDINVEQARFFISLNCTHNEVFCQTSTQYKFDLTPHCHTGDFFLPVMNATLTWYDENFNIRAYSMIPQYDGIFYPPPQVINMKHLYLYGTVAQLQGDKKCPWRRDATMIRKVPFRFNVARVIDNNLSTLFSSSIYPRNSLSDIPISNFTIGYKFYVDEWKQYQLEQESHNPIGSENNKFNHTQFNNNVNNQYNSNNINILQNNNNSNEQKLSELRFNLTFASNTTISAQFIGFELIPIGLMSSNLPQLATIMDNMQCKYTTRKNGNWTTIHDDYVRWERNPALDRAYALRIQFFNYRPLVRWPILRIHCRSIFDLTDPIFGNDLFWLPTPEKSIIDGFIVRPLDDSAKYELTHLIEFHNTIDPNDSNSRTIFRHWDILASGEQIEPDFEPIDDEVEKSSKKFIITLITSILGGCFTIGIVLGLILVWKRRQRMNNNINGNNRNNKNNNVTKVIDGEMPDDSLVVRSNSSINASYQQVD